MFMQQTYYTARFNERQVSDERRVSNKRRGFRFIVRINAGGGAFIRGFTLLAFLVVGVEHSRDVAELRRGSVEQVQHVVLLVAQHGSRRPQLLGRRVTDHSLLCRLLVGRGTAPRPHAKRTRRSLQAVQLREILICS